MDMNPIEKNLWAGVYTATIGLLIGDGENDQASMRAAYLANEAVDHFRTAAAPAQTETK